MSKTFKNRKKQIEHLLELATPSIEEFKEKFNFTLSEFNEGTVKFLDNYLKQIKKKLSEDEDYDEDDYFDLQELKHVETIFVLCLLNYGRNIHYQTGSAFHIINRIKPKYLRYANSSESTPEYHNLSHLIYGVFSGADDCSLYSYFKSHIIGCYESSIKMKYVIPYHDIIISIHE